MSDFGDDGYRCRKCGHKSMFCKCDWNKRPPIDMQEVERFAKDRLQKERISKLEESLRNIRRIALASHEIRDLETLNAIIDDVDEILGE
mgnify:FL=1